MIVTDLLQSADAIMIEYLLMLYKENKDPWMLDEVNKILVSNNSLLKSYVNKDSPMMEFIVELELNFKTSVINLINFKIL